MVKKPEPKVRNFSPSLARLMVLFVLVAGAASVFAQGTPQNATAWYGYEGFHPFREGEPWGLFSEGYIKRNRIILDDLSYFYRVGLNYEFKNGNRLTGGYAFQYNFPYDSSSEPYNWPDHRIWEQFLIRRPVGESKRVTLIHRFRTEQRWLGRKSAPAFDEITEWKFEDTFRYMFRCNIGVHPKWFAALYDELHLRLPPPEAEKLFDQNRVYAGIGIYLDERKKWRFETGYMFQSAWNSPDHSGPLLH